MDHIRALNQLRNRRTLSTALTYAIYDRRNSDHFCDMLEIEQVENNREAFLDELVEELRDAANYTTRPAFAYFPPKNELCDRRLIYLPLKDLTVRFAFGLVFSNEIESEIHTECFANRRAVGDEVNLKFTEDFASGGWARFCQWQRDRCDDCSVLLRTDISSFYDSVSHEYLVDAVCRHLALPPECEFVALFRRIIQVSVIHYSPRTQEIDGPHVTRQGLPLGDGIEGYLANLYLKDVDDAMVRAGGHYGRYVDDIRIFGQSRTEVIRLLRILQEELLRKGLNLNSSKTEIAENNEAQDELISRLYAMGDYEAVAEEAGRNITAQIDAPLEQFTRRFREADAFESGKDAKDFCKFMGAHATDGAPMVALEQRQSWHVDRLRETIVTWRGPSKHAAWLLVQTATYRGVPQITRQRAQRTIVELLSDENVSSYGRYRIVHHLIKMRQGRAPRPFRLFSQLTVNRQQRISALMESWLGAPAFELNLIALYSLRVGNTSVADLRRLCGTQCRRGCTPIRNALSALTAIPETPAHAPMQGLDNEPDAIPSPY